MRKRIALVGICCLGLLAIGSHPRYLEELRIGGGYGDAADGGADFDNSGNIAADGSVKATGGFEAGKDSTVRGVVTAWDGAGGNAPGALKLGSTNGTVGYLFMSNDRSGLRLHSSLPISDTDGEWLKAKTVTDLSSPPAIGATTPNTIKGTTGQFTGVLTAGSASNAIRIGPSCDLTTPPGIGGTTPAAGKFTTLEAATPITLNPGSAAAALILDAWDAGSIEIRSGTTTPLALIISRNSGFLITNTGATKVQFDGSGNIIAQGYLTTVGGVHVGGTSDPGTGNLVVAGDATLEGGDLVAGTAGTTRGTVTICRGAGTTTPGVLKLVSPNGTTHYFFAEDDGTLKVHNALPSSNSNGIEVGSQFSSTITTFTADDTSPSVSAGLLFRVPGTWTAGNNITMFDDGIAGQQIVVIGGDADCVVVDGTHVKLAGNWTGAAGKTLSLVFDGMDWFETARADN